MVPPAKYPTNSVLTFQAKSLKLQDMNLIFRLIFLVLKRIFYKPKASILEKVETQFWVNPFDVDINMHMNNGRYLSIMDLGRYDLMIKTDFFWKFFSSGVYPVVVSESIRFKKSLQPFTFFTLETQIESLTDRDFYIIHQFKRDGDLYATGYIQGRFRRRGQRASLKTDEVFQLVGVELPVKKQTELAKSQDLLEKSLIKIT